MGGEITMTSSGDWTQTPDMASIEGSYGVNGNTDIQLPGGIGIKLQGSASVTGQIVDENGTTTFEATATVQVSAQASANLGQVGVTGQASESYQVTFTVTMPSGSFNLETAQNIDPFNPLTWPLGTTVQFDQNRQSGRGLDLTFRGVTLGNNIDESQGSSMLIERTGDTTVKVTSGSTQGINALNSLGVAYGPASVTVGNDTSLTGSTVTEVEFDLGTDEGLAQYNYFITHGELMPPADANAPGIISMTQTGSLDYASVSEINASLGPFSVDLESRGVTVSSVSTTDLQTGESTVVTTQDLGNGTPLVITQKFDAQGNEILEERTYSATIEVTEESVEMVNALSGGSYEPGDTVIITFTDPQLEAYIDEQVNPAIDAQTTEDGVVFGSLDELRSDIEAPEVTPASFMRVLTQNHGQDSYGVVDLLWTIASWSDGDPLNDSNGTLPATVSEAAP